MATPTSTTNTTAAANAATPSSIPPQAKPAHSFSPYQAVDQPLQVYLDRLAGGPVWEHTRPRHPLADAVLRSLLDWLRACPYTRGLPLLLLDSYTKREHHLTLMGTKLVRLRFSPQQQYCICRGCAERGSYVDYQDEHSVELAHPGSMLQLRGHVLRRLLEYHNQLGPGTLNQLQFAPGVLEGGQCDHVPAD